MYVNTEEAEGWWYEGGGIYRDVWLLTTEQIAIDTDGVYVKSEKMSDTKWKVSFESTVVSKADFEKNVSLNTELIDASGKSILSVTGKTFVDSNSKATAYYHTYVENPVLWDIDNPYLYTVKTTVVCDGKILDEYITKTGFRYFTCDAERGFFLNGKQVKIKGVCAHEDTGLLGKAVPKNVHRYKMSLLKEMGANGYRTSHYQQNSAILDAADELGFIVLNEARWFSSAEESILQLETLVRRDRNRPSVFFWSLSNEEYYHLTEQGRKITKTLVQTVRRLDSQRPITSAVDKSPEKATIFDELDVVGINYNLELFDQVHSKYPEKAMFSSENCATGTTRSWYFPDCNERGYLSSYDKDANNWFKSRENTWKFISEREWIMGGYQWAGFEHRGETIWPRLSSQSGAIDMFLQKKDAFYQNQSHWKNEPMIHMLPHWNVDNFDDEPICVFVYTNCEKAELMLNGKSLGCKDVQKNTHLEWQVPYERGIVEVIGYNDGKIVAYEKHETSGAPEKLMLRLENEIKTADDVAIISCYAVDNEGRFVPDASVLVEFSTNEIGKIIATGSDICDHNPQNLPIRKMREGYITVALGVLDVKGAPVCQSGTIELYATSAGLKGAKLKIDF